MPENEPTIAERIHQLQQTSPSRLRLAKILLLLSAPFWIISSAVVVGYRASWDDFALNIKILRMMWYYLEPPPLNQKLLLPPEHEDSDFLHRMPDEPVGAPLPLNELPMNDQDFESKLELHRGPRDLIV